MEAPLQNKKLALIGTDRTRIRNTIVAILAFSVVAFLISRELQSQGRISDQFNPAGLLLLLGLLVLAACVSAYQNNGLLLSWGIVFGPSVVVLWHFFTVGTGWALGSRLGLAVGTSLVTTLCVGTIGYVIGIYLRRVRKSDDVPEESDWLFTLITGLEARNQHQYLSFFAILFATGFLVISITSYYMPASVLFVVGFFYPALHQHQWPVVFIVDIVVWGVIAAYPAYREAGLFYSWLMVFSPVFGALLNHFVSSQTSGAGFTTDVFIALVAAGAVGLIGGTIGFITGRVIQRSGRVSKSSRV